jgi:hypothetical protein
VKAAVKPEGSQPLSYNAREGAERSEAGEGLGWRMFPVWPNAAVREYNRLCCMSSSPTLAIGKGIFAQKKPGDGISPGFFEGSYC